MVSVSHASEPRRVRQGRAQAGESPGGQRPVVSVGATRLSRRG